MCNHTYKRIAFLHKCYLFVCDDCHQWKFVNPVNKRVFYTTAELYWQKFDKLPLKKHKIYSY